MSKPRGKLNPLTWLAATVAERNLIGSNDQLRVDDLCFVEGIGFYTCTSVDGGDASTWTGILIPIGDTINVHGKIENTFGSHVDLDAPILVDGATAIHAPVAARTIVFGDRTGDAGATGAISATGNFFLGCADTTDQDLAQWHYNATTDEWRLSANTIVELLINNTVIGPIVAGGMQLGSNSFEFLDLFTDKVALSDGITAPSEASGMARVYVDSADGFAKIKFFNGSGGDVATYALDLPSAVESQIDQSNSDQAVSNSSTETAVYSFSIPAGTMGTNGHVAFELAGEYENSTAGSSGFRIRVKLGSTTVWDTDMQSVSFNANFRAFFLVGKISNRSSASSQRTDVRATLSAFTDGSSTAVGEGAGWSGSSGHAGPWNGDPSTENTALARTIEITVQHQTQDTSIRFTKHTVMLKACPGV